MYVFQLGIINGHVTGMYGEVKVQLHALLILALEGKCLDSFLSHFTFEEYLLPLAQGLSAFYTVQQINQKFVFMWATRMHTIKMNMYLYI
jgi:hypothetical protein